ncbi:MAG: CBS domain-containing protein [Rhodospirillales bacterium]
MEQRHLLDIVHDQRPLVLLPDATVQEACRGMQKRKVGAVLVAESGGRLVGIFTGRDAVGRVLAAGRDPVKTRLADVMTPHPDTLPPGKTAIEALRLMADGGYRHIPVVEKGKLIGVISRGDFRAVEEARLDEETGLWQRI